MGLGTLKKIELIATNVQVCGHKRAFADGIPLVTYDSMRFSEVQRVKAFGTNDDSVNGALRRSKTKKPHCRNWPWAFQRMGIAGSRDWAQPILELRTAYEKVNGRQMTYAPPRLDRAAPRRGSPCAL